MVTNYIPLNNITKKIKYLMPHKDTMFNHLTRSKLYNNFDHKSGFYQIRMKLKDIHKITI